MGSSDIENQAAILHQAADILKKVAVTGPKVQMASGRRPSSDVPFAESKEIVAGHWSWQVRSMEEAAKWARRCPDPMLDEDGELEIRLIPQTRSHSATLGEVRGGALAGGRDATAPAVTISSVLDAARQAIKRVIEAAKRLAVQRSLGEVDARGRARSGPATWPAQ